MNPNLKRSLAALAATAAALGLAACGTLTGSDPAGTTAKKTTADLTGPQIATRAIKATKSADSLTMDLKGIVDGDEMTFRMALDKKGECSGSIKTADGAIQLLKTGDTAYLKFDDAYWKSQGKDGEAAKDLIGHRWMKTKATGADAKDLTGACDLAQVLGDFDGSDTIARKGALTTVNGTPAITLTERDGAEHYTLYVATQGKPYLLKLVTKGGKEPGTVVLSGFDKPVGVKVPAAKDTIDLDKLGS
jgi:hypothetical protein